MTPSKSSTKTAIDTNAAQTNESGATTAEQVLRAQMTHKVALAKVEEALELTSKAAGKAKSVIALARKDPNKWSKEAETKCNAVASTWMDVAAMFAEVTEAHNVWMALANAWEAQQK